MQLCEIFAANVRREREARGLSQTKLSEMAGVGEHTVFNYENVKHPFNLDIIESICKTLGVAPAEMLKEHFDKREASSKTMEKEEAK